MRDFRLRVTVEKKRGNGESIKAVAVVDAESNPPLSEISTVVQALIRTITYA